MKKLFEPSPNVVRCIEDIVTVLLNYMVLTTLTLL